MIPGWLFLEESLEKNLTERSLKSSHPWLLESSSGRFLHCCLKATLTLARPLVSFVAVLVLLNFTLKSDWAICISYDHQGDFFGKISAFMTPLFLALNLV